MAAPMDSMTAEGQALINSANCHYTAFFCEENIWKLCEYVQQELPSELVNCWVVFISNNAKAVPLWQQRQAKSPDQPVVWDYHVILLHSQGGSTRVYDLDSRLPFPCSFQLYTQQAIHSEELLRPQYKRFFRVIPAETYLQHFASDRTHMLSEDGQWQKTPPSYPCIQTAESSNNIEVFISMEAAVGWGTVLSHRDFVNRFLNS